MHETFDALQYATDFGTVSKESLKQAMKLGGGGILYLPILVLPWVPQTGMLFKDAKFMTPLPADIL